MAAKTVKFDSTVTSPGAIDDLEIQIQGNDVPSPGGVVSYRANLTDTQLTVVYEISALNGTGYTITYTCTSDGASKSDPANPSPIKGTITSNDYIEITLNITL